jgi:SAM-dependent methyltransferase
MLTVNYDRLGVKPGDYLLDMGCGAGRHAYEAARRGAKVVALDADDVEVKTTAGLLLAMEENGDVPAPGLGMTTVGNALKLPFADETFDRVIASEILEHIPPDTLAIAELARVTKVGGTLGITVPRWGPELINWALSDEYHNQPGGHIRIYRQSVLEQRIKDAGLTVTGSAHTHGLHGPYWWLKCAVGVQNDQHPLVKAYHQLLTWQITDNPLPLQIAEAVTAPLFGKSLVIYARKDEAV